MKQPRQCADGSYTYYLEEVGEAYHAPVGAALEAREKFVAPCNLPGRQKPVRILDVCFGLGYNTAAALEQTLEVTVTGLEIDKDILPEGMQLPFPFTCKDLFEKLAASFDGKAFSYTDKQTTIRVLIGDARERIAEVQPESIDVVFFDAFSPGKAPELWTSDFFKAIYEVCATGAMLVTYSCARHVREKLAAAGFTVRDGPVVGRRGPATLATKDS